ncbi:MAG: hypothetical protein JEY97_07190 [Bacteroidales bacterium]|nr:hypothetical protein [Bacteroidales bacterium]
MRKINSIFVLIICFLISTQITAQKTDTSTFKPHGKPIIKIFSNFHTLLTNGKENSAFEIKRAYFGYSYQLSNEFSVIIKLDIGSPDDESQYSLLKRYAYFKNAALKYKKGKLCFNFGLIDLLQFNVQETFWGHRYIYKSFQDEHKFGSSADIGVNIIYEFNEKISVDFTIMNGEGYVRLQTDDTYKSALGITFKPLKNLITRIYYDFTSKNITQSTLSAFAGYRFLKKFSLGFELNYESNYQFLKNKNMTGISTYSFYEISKKFQLFGRYDRLSSNIIKNGENPWNLLNDGSAIIAGLQFTPIKNVKISLSYQDWVPYAENMSNESYIFVNFEYKIK